MKRTVERLENGNLRVTVAFCFRNRNNNRKIVVDGEEDIPASTSDTLMLAIARGRRWQRYIDEGRFKNGTELAHAIGREPGKVAWTMRLAMLAPDIIHRILSGDIPQNLTLEKLRAPLPDLWEEPRAMLFGE